MLNIGSVIGKVEEIYQKGIIFITMFLLASLNIQDILVK